MIATRQNASSENPHVRSSDTVRAKYVPKEEEHEQVFFKNGVGIGNRVYDDTVIMPIIAR